MSLEGLETDNSVLEANYPAPGRLLNFLILIFLMGEVLLFRGLSFRNTK